MVLSCDHSHHYNLAAVFTFDVLFIQSAAAEIKAESLFNGYDLKTWPLDVPLLADNTSEQSPFLVCDGYSSQRAKRAELKTYWRM